MLLNRPGGESFHAELTRDDFTCLRDSAAPHRAQAAATIERKIPPQLLQPRGGSNFSEALD